MKRTRGRVTSKDVAEMAGVSRSTVSLVINNVKNARISKATKAKVLKAAEELDYQPNRMAQSLKTNKTGVIGLVIPTITNPFFPALTLGIEDVANEHGCRIFLCNSYRSMEKEHHYMDELISHSVDGVIFASLMNPPEAIEIFHQCRIPIVVFDTATLMSNVDYIRFDNIEGSRMATEYLFSLGHENVGFVSGSLDTQSRMQRLEGYKLAHLHADIPVEQENIVVDLGGYTNVFGLNRGDYHIDMGYRAANGLLERNPDITAILAANDMVAFGVLKALKMRGIEVPAKVSVVGFDDIVFSQHVNPPLTTIKQPVYEMGKAAARILISRIEGEVELPLGYSPLFAPQLIKRKSASRRCP